MGVSTEVHASSDPGEWTAFLQAQPAVWSFGLRQALRDTDGNFVRDAKKRSKFSHRNLYLSPGASETQVGLEILDPLTWLV